MLSTENMAGGLGASGSPPHPASAPSSSCHNLRSFLLVTSQEVVNKEGGSTVPRARNSSSFPIMCDGGSCSSDLLLHLSAKSVPEAGGGYVAESFARIFGSDLAFRGWQHKPSSQNQAWCQFKVCQAEIIIVSSAICIFAVFSLYCDSSLSGWAGRWFGVA